MSTSTQVQWAILAYAETRKVWDFQWGQAQGLRVKAARLGVAAYVAAHLDAMDRALKQVGDALTALYAPLHALSKHYYWVLGSSGGGLEVGEVRSGGTPLYYNDNNQRFALTKAGSWVAEGKARASLFLPTPGPPDVARMVSVLPLLDEAMRKEIEPLRNPVGAFLNYVEATGTIPAGQQAPPAVATGTPAVTALAPGGSVSAGVDGSTLAVGAALLALLLLA